MFLSLSIWLLVLLLGNLCKEFVIVQETISICVSVVETALVLLQVLTFRGLSYYSVNVCQGDLAVHIGIKVLPHLFRAHFISIFVILS